MSGHVQDFYNLSDLIIAIRCGLDQKTVPACYCHDLFHPVGKC